ncbi:MAG TPA: hypothetical protein PLQ97_08545 [Myxococcota bacterium]|nr:hypothetical protein [Myxococcota bacterium]HQK51404.1 hypothetical protein [Myxococcota bacterium]
MGPRRWTFVALLPCVLWLACSEATLEPPAQYGYDSQPHPVLIVNPDWGVLPLPNDLLNPVRQATVVQPFPGLPLPDQPPLGMALPIRDAQAAARVQALGYPAQEDSPLTKALVKGQNRLDGFLPSFTPAIPFSRPLDPGSLVPYDGTNGATANFWFLDITDEQHPVVLKPDEYLRVFDWAGAPRMPYMLNLRFPSPGPLQPPADFTPGHTYLVVATGWTEEGIRGVPEPPATKGLPVVADAPFLLMAAPTLFPDVGTTYIGADGGVRSGIVSDLAAAQALEVARQVTDQGLRVWESLPDVAGQWDRSQVVAAFSFTIATNPVVLFFDPIMAFLGAQAILPTPADALDPSTGEMSPAAASCQDVLEFQVDRPILPESARQAVLLFEVSGGQYREVPLEVAVTGEQSPVVRGTPKEALKPSTLYLAVVTSALRNPAGTRSAVDQSYFGAVRAAWLDVPAAGGRATFLDTPLVTFGDDGTPVAWNSPYLDSRLDTLILNGAVDPVTPEGLAAAEETLLQILAYLEGLRRNLKPHLDWLVLGNDGLPGRPGEPGVDHRVAEREDIVLAWTFTTGTCGGGR